MSKKIKFIQPQDVEELPVPKCCHAIHPQTVEEKYGHLSVGKGETSAAQHGDDGQPDEHDCKELLSGCTFCKAGRGNKYVEGV